MEKATNLHTRKRKKHGMPDDGHENVRITSTSLSKKSISNNWLAFKKATESTSDNVKVKTRFHGESRKPVSQIKKPKVTKVLAMDCEMVSNANDESMLARVSIVNFYLECVYDKYVAPTEPVVDYRTRVSGIRPSDLEKGEDFSTVQSELKELLHNKILVGHALTNDFRVLKFGHHWKLIRDTSKFKPFREVSNGRTPSLKKLTTTFLQETIQEGEHNSVEDARAAMKLYMKYRHEWESSIYALAKDKNLSNAKRVKTDSC